MISNFTIFALTSLIFYFKKTVGKLFIIVVFLPTLFIAQTYNTPAHCENCYGYYSAVVNDFLIIASKKNYRTARNIATQCSKKLNIPYHSRGATFDSLENKLIYPKDTCVKLSGTFPCDIVRGIRGLTPEEKDNGIYITIESTDNFRNLNKNLYIVVLGSGNPGDEELKEWREKAKRFYPDCYIKRTVLFGDGCGE